MKNYTKIQFAIGLLIMLAVVFRIIWVNKQYPQVQYQDVVLGQEAKWNDCTLKINGGKILDKEQAIEEFGKGIIKDLDGTVDFRLIEVNATIKNTSDTNTVVYIYDLYIENLTYANGIAAEIQKLTDTYRLDIDLKAKEEKQVKLCYVVYKNQFKKRDWNKMNLKDFWITGEYYPVKKRWYLL
ncbi:MAG: hypothetical protein IJ535_08055 [Pseudobutyrivibrio sp.]|uniref:hypothetical protein n=1 Tax=Pseudobutyrivibrio sp. TaxID=2014367 RepID=UPI0025F460F2|nr:hypothetical protein [Pseudobutyrivibrio sp.]MBQ8489723.1 hypothetical protein [Pseudobutyrivibrio sp.]